MRKREDFEKTFLVVKKRNSIKFEYNLRIVKKTNILKVSKLYTPANLQFAYYVKVLWENHSFRRTD